jgi:phosphatidate cytidylyltransferase
MKQRIAATLVLWGLVVALPLLLGNWGAFLLIAVFGLGAMNELTALLAKGAHPIDRPVALGGFALILGALILLPPWVVPPAALLLGGLSAVVIACLFRSGIGEFGRTCTATVGALMLILMLFATATLMIHERGLIAPIWIVAVAKFGDVGALLTGMWLGRHRMAPVLSPKKTWEGLGGGLLLSVIVSVAFVAVAGEAFAGAPALWIAGMAAIPISLAGVIGDLLESALKREANVKDSGTSIPGIGGFLDLTDSLILALPVGYFLLWILI